MHSEFSPADNANFIAATAVAYAEAFVAGRCDANKLYSEAVKLHFDLEGIGKQNDPASKDIVDHTELLITAMSYASAAKEAARLDRWREVMAALAKLVRLEVASLREAGAMAKGPVATDDSFQRDREFAQRNME